MEVSLGLWVLGALGSLVALMLRELLRKCA